MTKDEIERLFFQHLHREFGVEGLACLRDLGLSSELHFFRKGDLVIEQGRRAPRMYFFVTGFARYYSLSSEGKEFTKYFAVGPCLAGSTRAMVKSADSQFSIEAMDDLLAISFEWAKFKQAMFSHPDLLTAYAQLMEGFFIHKEEREYAFVLQSAQERYLSFVTQNPNLKDKIPLQYIASYIGITPVALSRIRKSLNLIE